MKIKKPIPTQIQTNFALKFKENKLNNNNNSLNKIEEELEAATTTTTVKCFS